MNVKLPIALRDDGHSVTVIVPEGANRPMLGTARPDEENKRAKVLRQWDPAFASPRARRAATIDEPLAQRAQTILSHEVDPALRVALNGGLAAEMPAARTESVAPGARSAARVPKKLA